VVVAHFELDDDKGTVGEEFRAGTYVVRRRLDNSYQYEILGAPPNPTLGAIRKDLIRMAAHLDTRKPTASPTAADQVEAITKDWQDSHYVQGKLATGLKAWLQGRLTDVDEDDKKEEERTTSSSRHAMLIPAMPRRPRLSTAACRFSSCSATTTACGRSSNWRI
jgi:hypothetical protein